MFPQEWGEPGEERINPVPKILETVPKAPNFVKSPSLDEMMANTLAPMAGTIGMDTEDVEDLIRSGHFISVSFCNNSWILLEGKSMTPNWEGYCFALFEKRICLL